MCIVIEQHIREGDTVDHRAQEPDPAERSPNLKRITRRGTLALAVPSALTVAGVRSVAALSLDGKGNDVCPCIFDVDEVVLTGDGTISVTGPCAVADPPEDVTIRVHVHGDAGAHAIGSETVTCDGSVDDEDRYTVFARIPGVDRFETGDIVSVHATVRIDPDDAPAVTGRWSWSGALG